MPSSLPSLKGDLDRIAKHIENRQQQLDRLESMFFQRGLDQESFVSGRPVRWGWLSSSYGYRNDPFNGRRTWHAGVDFAGKEGSDIIAVASGVVTWSSERYGYGNLVEINHGDGYSTRYAHCKEILVKVGEVVEKGQVLALMGSTGRSTGPHVHFEVLRKGMTLDPKKFLHRASR
jgi:murein DD-endopeptidase MepM/ murein hydrolase activator NlpD